MEGCLEGEEGTVQRWEVGGELGRMWERKVKDCFHPSIWRGGGGGYAENTGFWGWTGLV